VKPNNTQPEDPHQPSVSQRIDGSGSGMHSLSDDALASLLRESREQRKADEPSRVVDAALRMTRTKRAGKDAGHGGS